MENIPKTNTAENFEQEESELETKSREEKQNRAQMGVGKMFDENMEAKGTIRNIIDHGVIHSSER